MGPFLTVMFLGYGCWFLVGQGDGMKGILGRSLVRWGVGVAALGAIACGAPTVTESATGPEQTAAGNGTTTANGTAAAMGGGVAPIGGGVAPIADGVRAVPLTEGLEHPWGMAWLPDGSMLITERPGRLRRFRNGQLEPTAIAGVPEDVFVSGQGGLLDISVHPRFGENGLIFFTYASGTVDGNRATVARARWEGDQLRDWEVIFQATPDKPGSQHFGSRLTWLPDETLLVAIGDGGNPPLQLNGEAIRLQAQKIDSTLGKVVRITADGQIPPDNPEIAGNRSAIWSYGHRNIQGLTYDATRDHVWSTEHGARGGDEFNDLNVGENYGWPIVSHSQEYFADQPVSTERSAPGMIDPLIVWTPAIAPSGLMVYQGDRFSGWRGQLLAGGLVSRDVRRIAIDDRGVATEVEAISIGQRVRDVREGPDGLVYVLTDADNGQLIRLEPAN